MVYTLIDHRNDAIKCSKLCSETTRRSALVLNILLNRPKFSMVYTLVDHTNDVIKCSKLKWNHEPQASGFTAKFWTFYGVISMVYKSVDYGKFVVDLFFTITFIFVSREVSRKITRALLFFIFLLYLCCFKHQFTVRNVPHMLKFGSSLSMLRSKIIFTKSQTKPLAVRDMLRHFHGLCSHRP